MSLVSPSIDFELSSDRRAASWFRSLPICRSTVPFVWWRWAVVSISAGPLSPLSLSPVLFLTRMTSLTGDTNSLPSPCSPVWAAATITRATADTWSRRTTAQSSALSTSEAVPWAAPPYRSGRPPWAPAPWTARTVTPRMPARDRAATTASARQGRTMASTLKKAAVDEDRSMERAGEVRAAAEEAGEEEGEEGAADAVPGVVRAGAAGRAVGWRGVRDAVGRL